MICKGVRKILIKFIGLIGNIIKSLWGVWELNASDYCVTVQFSMYNGVLMTS